jgi:hypothetical protein
VFVLIPDVPKEMATELFHVCWPVITVAVEEFSDYLQIGLGTRQCGCIVREGSKNYVRRRNVVVEEERKC